MLAEFGDFVLDHEDLDEVLTEACRLVAGTLATDLAKVLQIEPARDLALVRAGIGWNEGVIGRERVSLGAQSPVAYVLEHREPVITSDINAESPFLFPQFLRDHGVVAVIAVPVYLPRREAWGVLQVDAREPRTFDQDDIDFLKTCGLVLGPVIDRIEAIAQREAARRKVAERETRLHRLLDNMGEGFGILSPGFVILEQNREAFRLDGRPAEEIVGRSHWEVYPGSEAAPLGQHLKRAMHERVPTSLEHPVVFADGRSCWLETRTYPHDDGTLAVFWRDITDRKAAHDRLLKSEGWLSSAAAMAQIGLWDWDIASGEVVWSDQHFAMLGYAPGEVPPSYEAWLRRVHPEDREREDALVRRAMAGGEDYGSRFRLCHPDGSIRWLRATGRFYFDAEGKPARMIGAALDVTDQVEVQERQQVLVDELQHRTRNLLAVVAATCDMTARGCDSFAEFRAKFGHRLEAMSRVQGLLSRLGPDDRVTFDELIAAELGAAGALDNPARVSLDGPIGVRLRSSTVQTLALALHELTTNAVKYGALTQPAGHLAIRWRLAPADEGPPWLTVEWRETGFDVPDTDGAPLRFGQGRALIEQALPYQLGAATDYRIGPGGVTCTIAIPLSGQGTPAESGR